MDTDKHVSDRESILTVLEVLSHPHRLILLAELVGASRPVAVADVTKAIAERSLHDSFEEIPERELERIRLGVEQFHVPKLLGIDAIAIDEGRNTIALTARGEWLRERMGRHIDWIQYLQSAER